MRHRAGASQRTAADSGRGGQWHVGEHVANLNKQALYARMAAGALALAPAAVPSEEKRAERALHEFTQRASTEPEASLLAAPEVRRLLEEAALELWRQAHQARRDAMYAGERRR